MSQMNRMPNQYAPNPMNAAQRGMVRHPSYGGMAPNYPQGQMPQMGNNIRGGMGMPNQMIPNHQYRMVRFFFVFSGFYFLKQKLTDFSIIRAKATWWPTVTQGHQWTINQWAMWVLSVLYLTVASQNSATLDATKNKKRRN